MLVCVQECMLLRLLRGVCRDQAACCCAFCCACCCVCYWSVYAVRVVHGVHVVHGGCMVLCGTVVWCRMSQVVCVCCRVCCVGCVLCVVCVSVGSPLNDGHCYISLTVFPLGRSPRYVVIPKHTHTHNTTQHNTAWPTTQYNTTRPDKVTWIDIFFVLFVLLFVLFVLLFVSLRLPP